MLHDSDFKTANLHLVENRGRGHGHGHGHDYDRGDRGHDQALALALGARGLPRETSTSLRHEELTEFIEFTCFAVSGLRYRVSVLMSLRYWAFMSLYVPTNICVSSTAACL